MVDQDEYSWSECEERTRMLELINISRDELWILLYYYN